MLYIYMFTSLCPFPFINVIHLFLLKLPRNPTRKVDPGIFRTTSTTFRRTHMFVATPPSLMLHSFLCLTVLCYYSLSLAFTPFYTTLLSATENIPNSQRGTSYEIDNATKLSHTIIIVEYVNNWVRLKREWEVKWVIRFGMWLL